MTDVSVSSDARATDTKSLPSASHSLPKPHSTSYPRPFITHTGTSPQPNTFLHHERRRFHPHRQAYAARIPPHRCLQEDGRAPRGKGCKREKKTYVIESFNLVHIQNLFLTIGCFPIDGGRRGDRSQLTCARVVAELTFTQGSRRDRCPKAGALVNDQQTLFLSPPKGFLQSLFAKTVAVEGGILSILHFFSLTEERAHNQS